LLSIGPSNIGTQEAYEGELTRLCEVPHTSRKEP
jgi:hypothetical protein